MRVYTCKDFKGHWPVGSSAVVLAGNKTQARKILLAKLKEIGLEQKEPISLIEIPQDKQSVTILNDGDY